MSDSFAYRHDLAEEVKHVRRLEGKEKAQQHLDRASQTEEYAKTRVEKILRGDLSDAQKILLAIKRDLNESNWSVLEALMEMDIASETLDQMLEKNNEYYIKYIIVCHKNASDETLRKLQTDEDNVISIIAEGRFLQKQKLQEKNK